MASCDILFPFLMAAKFQFYSQNFDLNFEISTLFFNCKLNPLPCESPADWWWCRKSKAPRDDVVHFFPNGVAASGEGWTEWVIVQSERLTWGLRTRRPRLGPRAAPTWPRARWSGSCSPRRSAPAATAVKDTWSVWGAASCLVWCNRGPPDLRPGEGEARPDVLSVHAAQEGGGSLQPGIFLPQEKLCVQNGVRLQGEKPVQRESHISVTRRFGWRQKDQDKCSSW